MLRNFHKFFGGIAVERSELSSTARLLGWACPLTATGFRQTDGSSSATSLVALTNPPRIDLLLQAKTVTTYSHKVA